jgi:hypothetical protein
MKHKIFVSIVFVIITFASCIYGILIVKKHFFPYSILKNYYSSTSNKTTDWDWAIGIYTGNSPFLLSNPKNIVNPILTAKDVTDVDAKFVADPFIVKTDSLYYMFFEVLNKKNNQGDIGYAESINGFQWKYEHIILDEPFHLSFPYIFKWENDYYIMPESGQDLSVRLYQATDFPKKWEYKGNLIKGYHFADPQIIRYNNLWWLFVCTRENDNLNVYYSQNLMGPWKQHPESPVIKNNQHIARGGGRILEYNHRLFRYTQDCFPTYGIQVFAFEITKLDTTSYEEKIVDNKSIIKASGSGWNKYGMHTVDPIQIGNGKWLSTVDGY